MIDYNLLSEDQQAELIDNSINLMRSIVEIAGVDEGTAMWDQICETMGPDIKGAILFSMLTGDNLGTNVCIVSCATVLKKVEVIKVVRWGSGLGLKEAKDVVDLSYTKPVTFKVIKGQRRQTVHDLRALGCEIR